MQVSEAKLYEHFVDRSLRELALGLKLDNAHVGSRKRKVHDALVTRIDVTRSAAEKVIESRFVLGGDDASYLASGLACLWSTVGAGPESADDLTLAPASLYAPDAVNGIRRGLMKALERQNAAMRKEAPKQLPMLMKMLVTIVDFIPDVPAQTVDLLKSERGVRTPAERKRLVNFLVKLKAIMAEADDTLDSERSLAGRILRTQRGHVEQVAKLLQENDILTKEVQNSARAFTFNLNAQREEYTRLIDEARDNYSLGNVSELNKLRLKVKELDQEVEARKTELTRTQNASIKAISAANEAQQARVAELQTAQQAAQQAKEASAAELEAAQQAAQQASLASAAELEVAKQAAQQAKEASAAELEAAEEAQQARVAELQTAQQAAQQAKEASAAELEAAQQARVAELQTAQQAAQQAKEASAAELEAAQQAAQQASLASAAELEVAKQAAQQAKEASAAELEAAEVEDRRLMEKLEAENAELQAKVVKAAVDQEIAIEALAVARITFKAAQAAQAAQQAKEASAAELEAAQLEVAKQAAQQAKEASAAELVVAKQAAQQAASRPKRPVRPSLRPRRQRIVS